MPPDSRDRADSMLDALVAAAHNKQFRRAAAGGAAGAVAKTVCAPLERVKILCQTGESSGIVATVRNVQRREGVAGLWRGNFTNVVRTIPNKGVLFMCSDSIKATLANAERGETLRRLPGARRVGVHCTDPLEPASVAELDLTLANGALSNCRESRVMSSGLSLAHIAYSCFIKTSRLVTLLLVTHCPLRCCRFGTVSRLQLRQ
jgi:hypothetical protein